MSRDYDPIEEYTGNGSLAAYDFDFKIEAKSQLRVLVYNASGVLQEDVRGTDTVYLSTVTFDSVDGGGTVTLKANLTSGYKLYLIQDNNAPEQTYQFRSKGSFSLKSIELALDLVLGPVQRLTDMMRRTLILPYFIDPDDFDTTLPTDLATQTNRVLIINSGGNGFDTGPNTDEISAAQGHATSAAESATDAQSAEDNAEAAQAAAEAAQTAAEAAQAIVEGLTEGQWSTWAEHTLTAGGGATDLTTGNGGERDETVDGVSYVAVIYEYAVIRGTTIFATGRIHLQYLNSSWQISYTPWYAGPTPVDHGITWSLGTSGSVATLRGAANAGDNATIHLSRRRIPA